MTTQTHPLEPTVEKKRVTIEASNHFFLALKTFGYTLLGYLTIVIPLILFFYMIGGR